MAKEASFDIVSMVDLQEVDNAYQQAARELTQRYDLKQTGATLDFSRKDETFTIQAPSDFVCAQVRDVLAGKLAKRQIDLAALRWGKVEPAAGASVRQSGSLVQGIDKETAKRIAKDVRDLKLKCKPTVEGDKLRVSSASRDVLQQVIAALREGDYGQPLQFVNYR
ncbi:MULTISPECIES: YajQ family cyclic di-GMP-binding protein [Olsenella]|uniref:YajQ family cyclic di-GMP-binding protein n=1 Tax=Olsenella TaxID=133925 RepID=UPI00071CFA2D|nr:MULTISPECIES: YajQ family cyclic di-GMP-binding protein [Olsenella]OFK24654.1 YajQ family cyclic di-GMP-binding protein [Olsenella sp. HMSC062G07]